MAVVPDDTVQDKYRQWLGCIRLSNSSGVLSYLVPFFGDPSSNPIG